MLHLTGQKLYFATKSLKNACVFSSIQKAQAAGYDSITEIEPYLLDDSPVCDEYICLAKGSATMLCRDGDSFSTQHYSLGPFWGLNPQSAIAALCEAHGKRKNVLTDMLYLFKIDQEYTDADLVSLHRQQPFTDLTKRIYDWDELPEITLNTDYINRYFQIKREAAERQRLEDKRRQREASPEMRFLSELMLRLIRQEASDSDKAYAGTADPDVIHAQFKKALSYKFTQEKFEQLIAFLRSTIIDAKTTADDLFAADDTNLLVKAYDTCLLELRILQAPHSRFHRLLRYLD